jgi:gp178|nr:MAG TPA: Protein of unknown function (DUF1642) [Caudoviricetes sp.]
MNTKELIVKIKKLPFVLLSERYISQNYVLELLKQLDEPQPLKLKDIISRMKQLFPLSRAEWIDEILKEFGEDFGSIKYRSGYEQGKLEGAWVGNQLKDADKIRQELNKPVVPQVVIDYYEFYKEKLVSFEEWFAKFEVESDEDFQRMDEVGKWLYDVGDFKTQTQRELALAMLIVNGLDAVEVEKEKRYTVVMKETKQPLYYNAVDKKLFFSMGGLATQFTRKQLEDAGFGEVFNSTLFEVEEVE